MGHIELARWADCILVAPATAHSSGAPGQRARGRSAHRDLSRRNVPHRRRARDESSDVEARRDSHAISLASKATACEFVGPGDGPQACGEFGPGPHARAGNAVRASSPPLRPTPLAGKRVLMTAGPTREPIDPVRYISNHSSGKQGFALAEAARDAGADVTLISGPVGTRNAERRQAYRRYRPGNRCTTPLPHDSTRAMSSSASLRSPTIGPPKRLAEDQEDVRRGNFAGTRTESRHHRDGRCAREHARSSSASPQKPKTPRPTREQIDPQKSRHDRAQRRV